MIEKKRFSFPVDGPYSAVLEIHESPTQEEKNRASYSGQAEGRLLFTIVVDAWSTKVLEEKIGIIQQMITHQGWSLKQ